MRLSALDLSQDEAIIHLQVLNWEIEILKTRLRSTGTEHIQNTISVLQERCNECMLLIFLDNAKSAKY
jgi:hypothetical protein